MSPPADVPSVGLIDETKTFCKGSMPTYVNDADAVCAPLALTTRGMVSGTAGFFSVRARDFTMIWVAVADTMEPLAPPKRTSIVPLKRPPRIVTVSPPAHEPVVGETEEMKGPTAGVPVNCRFNWAFAQSKTAITWAVPEDDENTVTSATPSMIVFEIVWRPISPKKPRSVVNCTEIPSGTGTPAFVTVARTVEVVIGFTVVADIETSAVHEPLPPPLPPLDDGAVGVSPE